MANPSVIGPWIAGLLGLGVTTGALAAPLCVAHRGDSAAYLENSRAALRSAVAVGAQGVEFDVHHSQDGVPFLLHDKTLGRTAEAKPGATCPLTTPLRELPAAVIQANCRLKNGEEIPQLEEVLDWLAETAVWVVVEFKDAPSPRSLDALSSFFRHHAERLRVISFDRSTLVDVEQHFPGAAVVTWALGVWVPRRHHAFDGVDVHWARRGRVRDVVDRDRSFGVWTIDDPNKMRKWADRGATFVTTNLPAVCLQTFATPPTGRP